MEMTLYTADLSPNCRRVEATVHHLGFAEKTEIRRIVFTSGELQTEKFRAINPNGKVPVLIHDDYVLWESMAILHYLAGLAGDEKFMPVDNSGRAEVLRWQSWETVHFNRAVGSICWETVAKPLMGMGDPDEAAVEKGLGDFHRYAKILEAHLKDRRFILGDDVSIADFSVGSFSALILNPNSRISLENYPVIGNWLKAIEAVPAWAKTAPVPK